MGIDLTDLPKHLQAQATQQLDAQTVRPAPAADKPASRRAAAKPKAEPALAREDFAISGTPQPGKARHIPGRMNGTEKRYADILDERIRLGEVVYWAFESLNFRLGDGVYYRPDFLIQLSDGSLEIHECKGGFIRDDSRAKMSVFKEKYPFPLLLCQYVKKEWEIKPA